MRLVLNALTDNKYRVLYRVKKITFFSLLWDIFENIVWVNVDFVLFAYKKRFKRKEIWRPGIERVEILVKDIKSIAQHNYWSNNYCKFSLL